ncbi:MAG TPA: hypothetical protein VFH73_13615 [Polyangia bacterium]|jgi:hypothetical protein|nr:hypothetical protein [Polyangia bacterium]
MKLNGLGSEDGHDPLAEEPKSRMFGVPAKRKARRKGRAPLPKGLDYNLLTTRAPGETMDNVTGRLTAIKRLVRRLLRTESGKTLFYVLTFNTRNGSPTAVVVTAHGMKWRLLAMPDETFEEVRAYLQATKAMSASAEDFAGLKPD